MNRKRDMDLIRSLMLEIENGREDFEPIDGEVFVMMSDLEREQARESQDALFYHLDLLCRGRFIEGHFQMDGTLVVERITWAGHDFLDGVRDPDIWERTKAGAAKVGGFTADSLLALAKGLIKQKIQQHTGVEVDL